MLTCLKTSRGIVIPLPELKRLIGQTHKILTTQKKVTISKKSHEDELDEALRTAKNAPESDFVNI